VTDRDDLLQLIKELAVVHGRVILSSGREADYYVDLRRVTLHRAAAPLVGRVMREVTADWSYDAVGGLTLGADPVASAMLHASGGEVDAFVVRKSEKQHGLRGGRRGRRGGGDRRPGRRPGGRGGRAAVSGGVHDGRPRPVLSRRASPIAGLCPLPRVVSCGASGRCHRLSSRGRCDSSASTAWRGRDDRPGGRLVGVLAA
jgi:hypothetical protein